MIVIYFFKAMMIGFILAMSIGPLAIICINRTLKYGFKAGYVSALGVSTVDGIYAFFSILGLGVLIKNYYSEIIWVRIIGIIFLFYIGYKITTNKIVSVESAHHKNSLIMNYLSTFIITITNPLTIISFSSLFISIYNENNIASKYAGLFFFAVFLGSAIWHFILCLVAFLLREKISIKYLKLLNIITGYIIIIFAIKILINIIK